MKSSMLRRLAYLLSTAAALLMSLPAESVAQSQSARGRIDVELVETPVLLFAE